MDIVDKWGVKDICVSSDLSMKQKRTPIARRSNITINSIVKTPVGVKSKNVINKPLPSLGSNKRIINTPVSGRVVSKIYTSPRTNIVRRDSFIQSSSNDSLDMFQNEIIDVSNKERNTRDVYGLRDSYDPIKNTDNVEYKLTHDNLKTLNILASDNISCSGCKNCVGCKNCFNCTDCMNCYNCADCVGCDSCKNCIGLKNKKHVQDRYIGNVNINK